MLVRALLVCAVWLGLALWLDFPHAMVAAGVVVAFLLAWRDDVRDRFERRRDEAFDDEQLYE